MREIKFRVYDKDLKKMRYLNDPHDSIGFRENGNAYYHNLQTGLGEWFSDLMQYTGLKDKNGVEVYEGDVVNYMYFDYMGNEHNVTNYVVKDDYKDWIILEFSEDLEVIDNVYGNNKWLRK